MELFEPEHQIGNQEVTNLVAAVVEDQRSPLFVLTDARIAVFVEVCAVKEGQAMGILGEVAGHPVDDDADAFGVAAIHKGPEFIRSAVAAGGGVPAGDLITPGAIEGMLGDRHQFDVGESPFLDVRDQAIRQLGVGEQPSAGFHVGSGHRSSRAAVGLNPGFFGAGMDPAAEMHLIHGDGLLQRIAAVALLHPGAVRPLEALEASHH